jgi:long-chain acyl-CoA synthetase
VNISETPLLVPEAPDDNVTDLLEDRVAQTPDRALFSVPENSSWKHYTTTEFRDQVVALAKGFVAAGIQPADRVAFMCQTRYEWTLVDFALFYAGAIMVPVYETSSPLQMHWILEDSGATAFLAETQDHYDRFADIKNDLKNVANEWVMEAGALEELVQAGRDIPDEEIERRRNIAKGKDPATLIYTSGSFGRPKGCILTHSNFVDLSRNAAAGLAEVIEREGSATLLFITLAHVFARFISILSVCGGVRVGHSNTADLLNSLNTFKPTFLLAVPRVFEKVYNSAEQKAEGDGKGKIFRLAAKTAVDYSKATDRGKVSPFLRLKFKLFNKLVFEKLRALLGGKIEYAVSGAAPLSTYLAHFYRALGVQILEGYGLTETTAPAAVNLPGKFKIGTVGNALPGVSIRIGEKDEVQVKGICVFDGYWQNDERTQDAFTEDGYFKTGDCGVIDDEQYLKITGRLKELIVTAGGKNVSPAVLEDSMRSNAIIGQPVVVGDQKPFIAALVTLDMEMLPTWLKNNGEDPHMSLEEATENPKVREEIQRAVDEANTHVSRAESIRKFTILPVEFTEDNGHLTPKLSLKRANILRDFADEIHAIYGSRPETVSIRTARDNSKNQ